MECTRTVGKKNFKEDAKQLQQNSLPPSPSRQNLLTTSALSPSDNASTFAFGQCYVVSYGPSFPHRFPLDPGIIDVMALAEVTAVIKGSEICFVGVVVVRLRSQRNVATHVLSKALDLLDDGDMDEFTITCLTPSSFAIVSTLIMPSIAGANSSFSGSQTSSTMQREESIVLMVKVKMALAEVTALIKGSEICFVGVVVVNLLTTPAPSPSDNASTFAFGQRCVVSYGPSFPHRFPLDPGIIDVVKMALAEVTAVIKGSEICFVGSRAEVSTVMVALEVAALDLVLNRSTHHNHSHHRAPLQQLRLGPKLHISIPMGKCVSTITSSATPNSPIFKSNSNSKSPPSVQPLLEEETIKETHQKSTPKFRNRSFSHKIKQDRVVKKSPVRMPESSTDRVGSRREGSITAVFVATHTARRYL
ncbi:unnamed protein product [Fraxinus pennsylvanica]|uniref:Uncharacterized protein n=1 Tax=Fraxinus pennsylvanica TaxID=56036 RepID=A0AAD2A2Q9_9LAMI|nr:unnamed protein product [Fraxinus pennsylvanica]